MNRKKFSLLVVGFLSALLAVNSGCKKENKDEVKAPEQSTPAAPSTPPQGAANSILKIEFGTPQAKPFLKSGWSGNESDAKDGSKFNWAVGKSATLALSVPKNQVKLTANVKIPTFANKGPQLVTVKVNGKEAGKLTMPDKWVWTKYSVTIDADNNRPDVSTVEFDFSQNLPTPDTRKLAVLFESITLE
jgi:hypothetical protein